MQHLDEGTIHAWLDGALDTEEAARVERHAAECATCAAAVAEARGLVAGASRILSALDETPGGVVPAARSGSSGGARPGRPLWRVLRVTPARAAAAAILFVAAGTVLVLRQRPNDGTMFDSAAGPAVVAAPAVGSPSALSAPRPPHEMTTRKPSAQVLTVPTAAAPAPRAAELPRAAVPAPAVPAPAVRGAAVPAAAVESVAAKKAAGGVAGGVAGALSTPKSTTATALEQIVVTSAGARPEARRADIVAGAAPTPAANMAPRFGAAPAKVDLLTGCYTIEADAAAGLPARVQLDSARLERTAAFGERAGFADASIGARYAVKAISASTSPATVSYWQPTSNGGLRLFLGGMPPTSIDLHPISPVAFTGTRSIGDRQIPVTLQRLTDCPMR